MHWRSPLCFALICPAILTTVLSGAVLAGPLPGALQAPAARALVQGPHLGGPPLAVAVDPQKAAALGLPGLAAGDTVEVARPSRDVWTITDPKSGRRVESRREPDLGP